MAIPSIFIISDNYSVLPEFCCGAKKLADSVTAIVFGDETAAKAAANCSADKMIFCPVTEEGAPEDYASAIAAEIKAVPNAMVLVNNSTRGHVLAGKISVYLDTAVINAANDLSIEEDKFVCSRMVYGGTAQRKEVFTKPYGIVTISSGIFDVTPDACETTDIRGIEGAPKDAIRRISRNEKKEGAVNLVAAKRIVDVGRGLAAEEDLDMCRNLAKLLDAMVGCSRPVAENNKWMPKACYLGITGVQVKPDLIITLGLSGQVQHIGGINKSKVIVAINKDKSAPIFKNADFGLVGDMYKIVPALIEKLS
ncbi:electron transfer flavoprotein subunit alpha/FixB family protein [Clostridium brassicae]|uniref:FAD-binding protein n=1 Tax=Clostridium brassicae TaxID=2999072 RepID=A0ABT4D7H0_9CLOT|nr:FAD-binding protein [Clostridium brassicae]MCY6957633.1 FAD-binding protein [Clostridium brassicae]